MLFEENSYFHLQSSYIDSNMYLKYNINKDDEEKKYLG